MNAVPKYACNYAVLKFLPYPETDEFVNLGVVVHCPALGLFDMRIEPRKHRRVTDFFPELNRENFRAAREAIINEVTRIKTMCGRAKDLELGRRAFLELVRHRETIFRFGEIRTILTDNPANLVELLFARHVNRHFAQPKEYQETIMAQRFFDALQTYRPHQVFRRNQVVGTAEYHVRIPICSDQRNKDRIPQQAVKPLDLDRADPTAVIDHGDAWIQRVRRLKLIDCMPERFIFAVRYPKDEPCAKAANKIYQGLRDEGVVLINDEERDLLSALATD